MDPTYKLLVNYNEFSYLLSPKKKKKKKKPRVLLFTLTMINTKSTNSFNYFWMMLITILSLEKINLGIYLLCSWNLSIIFIVISVYKLYIITSLTFFFLWTRNFSFEHGFQTRIWQTTFLSLIYTYYHTKLGFCFFFFCGHLA